MNRNHRILISEAELNKLKAVNSVHISEVTDGTTNASYPAHQ